MLATAWAAWAAASAAKAANRSLELFKQAEGGELVPTFVMNAYNTVTIGLKNVGRTPVHILHADICCAETPPSGPIETFFTVGEFSTDVLISPEKPYIFGEAPQPIAHTHPECWFLGGAIYRTIFGEPRVAKIAIYLDRTTGKYKVYFPADFSKWDAMVQGLTKGGRKG